MQPPENPYNQPPLASPTDQAPRHYAQMPPGANNSGMGAQSVLPDELRGLNWGAFLLNWIWAIGHSVWLGLLCLVPYVGVVMGFVLLFKGNEWAWQNRKWDSIDQFREVEKKWMMWGLIVFVVSIVLSLAAFSILGAMVSRNPNAYTPNNPNNFAPR